MTTQIDLLIAQGATYSNTFIAIANTDLTVNGYSCNAVFRKEYSSINSYAFGTSLSNTGNVTLSLTANISANVIPGHYVYDVLLSNPSGTKIRVREGFVEVLPKVS